MTLLGGDINRAMDELHAARGAIVRVGLGGGKYQVAEVGRCRLTVSKPVLKTPMFSALEATI